MCGRFTQKFNRPQITEEFFLPAEGIFDPEAPGILPNYNLAPSQPASIIVRQEDENKIDTYRFGLLPSFARSEKEFMLINARSETVFEKASFKRAILKRRCLIPVNGFYEWKKIGNKKVPYYIYLKDSELFSLAGIYEHTTLEDGRVLMSFAILTTSPNELMNEVHDRMPVIIPPEKREAWLDPNLNDVDTIRSFFASYPADAMDMHRVDTFVNKPENNEPGCIEPVDEDEPPPGTTMDLF